MTAKVPRGREDVGPVLIRWTVTNVEADPVVLVDVDRWPCVGCRRMVVSRRLRRVRLRGPEGSRARVVLLCDACRGSDVIDLPD